MSTTEPGPKRGAGPTAQRIAITLVAFVAWFATALTVEDCYPFGRFEFFRSKMDTASRIFAVPASGTLEDPMGYADWHCDGEIAPDPEFIDGSSKAALVYMDRHQGPPDAGPRVDVVRRTWRFEDGVAAPHVTDTHLLRCTARRVEGQWQFALWQRY